MFAAKKQSRFEKSDFQSMKREQEMLKKMEHLNIVRLIDSYEDESEVILILELCECKLCVRVNYFV